MLTYESRQGLKLAIDRERRERLRHEDTFDFREAILREFRCVTCKEEKPATEFAPYYCREDVPDRHRRCRSCDRERQRRVRARRQGHWPSRWSKCKECGKRVRSHVERCRPCSRDRKRGVTGGSVAPQVSSRLAAAPPSADSGGSSS